MNPSAREVLEAERKECYPCQEMGNTISKGMPCTYHQGKFDGIELAERADLERVVEALKIHRFNAPGIFAPDLVSYTDAIEAIRAAFPEVKEGEAN